MHTTLEANIMSLRMERESEKEKKRERERGSAEERMESHELDS